MKELFGVATMLAMLAGPLALIAWVASRFPAVSDSRPTLKARARIALIGSIGLLFVGCTGFTMVTAEENQKTADDLAALAEQRRSAAVVGKKAPAPQKKPAPTAKPEPTTPATPYLGDLVAVDVYLNLTKEPYRFKREDTFRGPVIDRYTVKRFDSDTGANLVVDAYTSGSTRLVKTYARVEGRNLAAANWLLPYIATLPVDGVDRQAAKDWVAANIPKATGAKELAKQFGPVVYTLDGGAAWRSLSLNTPDYDLWLAMATK